MTRLGEPRESPDQAEATAQRLRGTSLLEQVELLTQIGKDQTGLIARYLLHPSTVKFINDSFGEDEEIRLATHRRLGDPAAVLDPVLQRLADRRGVGIAGEGVHGRDLPARDLDLVGAPVGERRDAFSERLVHDGSRFACH